MKIIVDAFGGDHAPLEILKGAMQAVDAYDVDIILTGKEAEIRRCAAENRLQLRRTRIVDAPQVITMEDDAKSVLRSKKDSSLGVAFQLLKAGEGDALVSAGNTGAVTVGATLITGRIKGVKRPAIASVMPSANKPFLMMDCGANAECKPEFLCQFGLLGSLYMQHVLHVKNPRVALANNGTEPTKGTPTVRAAYDLMTAAPYNFVGNIEGRQIPFGDAGVAKVLMNEMKGLFKKNAFTLLSALGVSGGLKNMKAKFDYKEYGGAVMLGVQKPVVKAHGSADARTFKNAIKQAVCFLQNDLIGHIETALAAPAASAE